MRVNYFSSKNYVQVVKKMEDGKLRAEGGVVGREGSIYKNQDSLCQLEVCGQDSSTGAPI